MDLSQLFISALVVAPADEPSVGIVVVTGLVLVFAVLILLYAIIIVQGKIFSAIDKKKSDKAATPPTPVVPAAPVAKIQAITPAYIQPGISGEVVAAISCAIASMDSGYSLRSLTQEPQRRVRSAWGRAGISANTEPF